MVPKTISHYEILGEIGRGGMGVVYRARDVKLGRDVALKILPPELTHDPDRRARFELEARAAAALEHPHIAVVHEIDEFDGIFFIVMELIRGKPLGDVLRDQRLSPTRACDLAIEMAEGLSSAHQKGIVHRDLKPNNIMLTSDGHIKIIDFGLAKLTEPAPTSSEADTAVRGVTEPGTIVGTLIYVSPEQARGYELDHRSDIFSFGVVLHELVTAKVPFGGSTAADTISAILTKAPPRLSVSKLRAQEQGVIELQRVIDKCLAKEPDERYQGMKDLVIDLRKARWMLDPDASAAAPQPSASFSWRVTAAASAVALVVALTGILVFRGMPSMPDPVSAPADVASASRSVAVVGFRNLTGSDDKDWLSTAFAEMLSTELATGSSALRIISGENVARMKTELSLRDADSFADDTLTRIQGNLGADFVVVGSYVALGDGADAQIRLDMRLQEVAGGETVLSLAESGAESSLFQLVTNAGAKLREQLGLSDLSAEESRAVRASVSSHPRANRLYSEGLAKLRARDANAARELLEQAVAIDPDYAMAHSALSAAWLGVGYDARGQESARTALDLAEGLPREHNLMIEARYHESVFDWDGAADNFRVLWGYHPENIDYGLRMAEALAYAGLASEALETVEELRSLEGGTREDPRIDLVEAHAAELISDFDRAARANAEAARKAEGQEAWLVVAQALNARGGVLTLQGQPEEAAKSLERAQSLFAKAGDRRNAAQVLANIAIVLKYQGDFPAAEDHYRDVIQIARDVGDRHFLANNLNNLAVLVQEQGQLATADGLLREALDIATTVRDRTLESAIRDTMAIGLYRSGRLLEAEEMARRSLSIDEELGSQIGFAWNDLILSNIHFARGELSEARELLVDAREICEERGYRHLEGYVLAALGELRLAQGAIDEAAELLEAARRLREELGESSTVAESRLAQALLMLEQDRPSEAEALAAEAAGTFEKNGRLDELARAHGTLARSLADQGDAEAAALAIAPTIELASTSESPALRLAIAMDRSRVDAALGNFVAARNRLVDPQREAERRGMVGLDLEIRLLSGVFLLESGEVASGTEQLVALGKEAEDKGFLWIGRKAAALEH